MVPNFALSLAFDGVSLLRRVATGWARIEDVALADADLDAAMARLHGRARELDPDGDAVILLLPDDQIRYLDRPDPGDDRAAAARAALEGETPYAVADLAIDHAVTNGRLQIAAVARETLQEAESFAVTHGFRPAAFGALPRADAFAGAAFFGAADGWTGAPPQRPDGPVAIVAADAAVLTPKASAAAPAEPNSAEKVPFEPESPERAASEPATSDPMKAGNATAAASPKGAGDQSGRSASDKTGSRADASTDDPANGDADPGPALPFSSRRGRDAGTDASAAANDPTGATGDAAQRAPAAPGPRIPPPIPPRADVAAKPPGAKTKAATDGDEPRPAGPTIIPPAPGTASAPATASAPPRAAPAPKAAPSTTAPSATTQGDAFRERILDRAREARAADTTPGAARPVRRGTDPLGGKPKPAPRSSRRTGLALTAALLLALGGFAGWSMLTDPRDATRDTLALLSSPDEGEAPPSAPAPQVPSTAPETPAETAGAAQPDASAPVAATPTTDTETAALDPDELIPPAPMAPDPADPPAQADGPPSPEEAAATYAATGIWQRAPEQPDRPEPGAVEDVYAASIDPDVQQFDAVALPPADGYSREAPPPDPGLPPPPDLRFEFDDRGLVRATPDGALTPEGLRIFTGRPPAVPPLRSAALPGPRADAPPPSDYEGLRPAARPEDLSEQRQRATLQGRTLDELAVVRPALRPGTVQDQAAIDTPDATDEAVARSVIPVPRPRDMAQIVSRAQEFRAQRPASLPQTVSPDIPSTAEVARAATVRNAVNLSDAALFGVYGDASNRRALVRLPNGNYEKVQVGDRLDGGEVLAISENQLRYRKRGRTVTLEMPRG